MKVVEYVPGELLVLRMSSRSRGREILHHLALCLRENGQVAEVSCSCESFSYRRGCHHLTSLRDLAGAPRRNSSSGWTEPHPPRRPRKSPPRPPPLRPLPRTSEMAEGKQDSRIHEAGSDGSLDQTIDEAGRQILQDLKEQAVERGEDSS